MIAPAHVITAVLIALVLGAVYALVVLTHPVVRCLGCKGKKMRRQPGRKPVKCKACKATGLMVLPGAGPVHRFYWSVFGDRFHDKRKADLAEQLAARKKQGARR